MPVSLPLVAADPERQARLKQQRREYEFDYEYLPGHAIHKSLPFRETFSPTFVAEFIPAIAGIVPNALAVKAREFFDPLDELDDYRDFFQVLKIPAVAAVYQNDDSFAEQRLSGVNPLVLRLLKADDARAGVVKALTPDQVHFDVNAELAKGNIYVADYTGTDPAYRGPSGVQGGTFEKGKKYMPKPLAFFRWNTDVGKLVPVAIQLLASDDPVTYKPSKGRVYLPSSSPDWLFAKLCVQCADGNHHELSTHLGRTHLVMDPIAVGTARNLDVNHPLSILLRVHFRFNLSIDNLAKVTLLGKGGTVDTILAGTLDESLSVTAEACRTWDITKFAFPADIKARGLADNTRLPHYPYRDDGMLVWDAVNAYVTKYLKYYYPNDAAVTSDTELQAWAKELADQTSGGKVKGMPSKFSSVDELIPIVACIVFTSGPQHSAVNYSQYEYYAFAPNMPLALYNAEGLTRLNRTITMPELLQVLPPVQSTNTQLSTAVQLASYQFDVLGFYEKSVKELYKVSNLAGVFDPQVISIIENFQKDLSAAESKIEARNKKRSVPYNYMKPSKIANSISV